MQQWEYKTINFGIHLSALLKIARWELEVDGKAYKKEQDVVDYLDRLGVEGWELVTSVGGSDNAGNITKGILFFKRPKASQ